MHTHANKKGEHKSQAIANSLSKQKGDASAIQLSEDYPRVKLLPAVQAMIDPGTIKAQTFSNTGVIQRMKLKPNWSRNGVVLSARELLIIFNEELEVRNALLKVGGGDAFIDPIKAAHGQHGVAHAVGPGNFKLGGSAFRIAKGQYVNLQDNDRADAIYGNEKLHGGKAKKVRGEGPDYAMLHDALAHYVVAGNALPGDRDTDRMDDAAVMRLMRALLENPGIEVHPVLAHLTAVMGGAEGLRNPRTPAALAMFGDLVESGESTLAEGLGPQNIENESSSGHHLDSIDRAEFFGINGHARPEDPEAIKPEAAKLESKKPEAGKAEGKVKAAPKKAGKPKASEKRELKAKKALYEAALKKVRTAAAAALQELMNSLDLEAAWKNSATKKASLRGFGGAIPMTGEGSEKEGVAAVPGMGAAGGMNLVQVKEASLVARWLDVQIRRLPDEALKTFDALLKKNRREAVAGLIRERVAHLGHSMAADAGGKKSSLVKGKGSSGSDGRGGYQLNAHQQARLAHHHRADAPVAADGDCFFSSLRAMGIGGGDVQHMRTTLADAVLADNGAVPAYPFIPAAQRANIAGHIRAMGDYANFAGDVTPMIAAAIWNLTLTIINPDAERTVGAGANAIIITRFTAPAEHYHATAALPVVAPAAGLPAPVVADAH